MALDQAKTGVVLEEKNASNFTLGLTLHPWHPLKPMAELHLASLVLDGDPVEQWFSNFFS